MTLYFKKLLRTLIVIVFTVLGIQNLILTVSKQKVLMLTWEKNNTFQKKYIYSDERGFDLHFSKFFKFLTVGVSYLLLWLPEYLL